MYHREHMPPHFHAQYAEHKAEKAEIAIETLEVINGELPIRVLALVIEWAVLHRAELRQDWERAVAQQELVRIAPLI